MRGRVEAIGADRAIHSFHPLGQPFKVIAQSPKVVPKGFKSRATDQRTVIMNQPLER